MPAASMTSPLSLDCFHPVSSDSVDIFVIVAAIDPSVPENSALLCFCDNPS